MEATGLKGFITRNWLQLLLGLVFLFVLLQKDLSFQINLRAPVPRSTPLEEKMPLEQPAKKKEREKYTEKLPVEEDLSEVSVPKTDRFDLSSLGADDRNSTPAEIRLSRLDDRSKRNFLKRFAHVAIEERKKYGIPAAITLGNALLLSYAGEREIAIKANNFFALPCSADWEGRETDADGRCYRRYQNAWTSFRDHSLYLTTGKLSALRRLDPDDYKGWARGLEKAGFSGESEFARQLINVIEEYRLYELDE